MESGGSLFRRIGQTCRKRIAFDPDIKLRAEPRLLVVKLKAKRDFVKELACAARSDLNIVMGKRKIAIVGTGISGLGALYALKETGSEVHVFESERRLGGHTNTVDFTYKGHDLSVDTGFIVLNTATYPNFIRFLQQLRVETVPTEMSFGVSRDRGAFEWAGTSMDAIFAQRTNIFSPSMWRMIFDIVRFNHFALDILRTEEVEGCQINGEGREERKSRSQAEADAGQSLTIGEYLKRERYSDSFRDNYLIPMTAAVWSTGPDKCALEFPAVTLVRFMWNHHLLSTISARPQWLTIKGFSRQYIDALMQDFPRDRIHLSSRVKSARNQEGGGVSLRVECSGSDRQEAFDHVILACHGDQVLEILGDSATGPEMEIFNAFETTPNMAYLHSDSSLMPRRRAAWASWNLSTSSADSPSPSKPNIPSPSSPVTLTYNMNILQPFVSPKMPDLPVLVTLNPTTPPSNHLLHARIPYTHPVYSPAAIAAQRRLPQVQNVRSISYAGAWTGYGFHEDGFVSGVKAAMNVGGKVPWELVDTRFIRGGPGLQRRGGWAEIVVRAGVRVVQAGIEMYDTIWYVGKYILVALLAWFRWVSGSVGVQRGRRKAE